MKKAFVIAYVLFVCTFRFLPKSVETGVFIVFVLVSAGYVLLNHKLFHSLYNQDPDTRRLRRMFVIFLGISVFYLFLSFFNLPKFWGINGLLFRRSFIPRHFIIVAELLFPVCMGYYLYRLKVFDRIKVSYLALLFLLSFFYWRDISITGVLLISLALISWKLDNKFWLLPAFFIFTEQTAYVLGFFAMVFLVFFEKPITRFLRTKTIRKIITLSLFSIIFIFIVSGVLTVFINNDANSLWRLRVWENEIHSLAQSLFTGVGFGSAYVTEDIIFTVNNSNMYFDDYGSIDTGLFVVANHSSILNMFYRMGLVGGFAFLALNVFLIQTVIKFYHGCDTRNKSLLWRLFATWIYETIIILLNPGLEMMQFAISYVLCVAMLLAAIFEARNSYIIRHHPSPFNKT